MMPDTVPTRSASGIPFAEVLAWVRDRFGSRAIDRKDDFAMGIALRRSNVEDAYTRARAVLDGFRRLPENWDGDGASRLSKAAIDRALIIVESLEKQAVPAPRIAAMPDGGVELCWSPVSRNGRLEIEARLEDDGDELMIGYAHVPGFEVHERINDPYRIANLVRDRLAAEP